jgi:hypothetical protein
MTLCLVAGVLAESLVEKQSKSGRPFWVAKLKSKEGEALVYWRLTIFSESIAAEMGSLAAGDGLSASGRLDVSTWTDNSGTTRINHGLLVEGVLPLRARKKDKAPAEVIQFTHARKTPPPPPLPIEPHDLDRYSGGNAGHEDLNDQIPF